MCAHGGVRGRRGLAAVPHIDRHGHLIGMATAGQDGTWALALSRQTGNHYLRSTRVTDYVDVR